MAVFLVGVGLSVFGLIAQVDAGVPNWLSSVSDLGIVVFLIAVLFGGLRDKPWWVPGAAHRTEIAACEARTVVVEKDRDFYRTGLFRALGAAERTVETTRTLAEHTLAASNGVSDDALLQEVQRRGLKT